MEVYTAILFILILAILVGFIIAMAKKSSSGLKLILLGINITLFGGILAVDPNSSLGGIEYGIALLGLILSIIGVGKRD